MANNNKIYNQILLTICRAQAASDTAKGIDYLQNSFHLYNVEGYGQKDRLIASAIKMINNNKTNLKISYFITEPCGDQNGARSQIIYFETEFEGEILQISFHKPLWFKGATPLKSKGRPTTWDEKSSREAARKILSKIL